MGLASNYYAVCSGIIRPWDLESQLLGVPFFHSNFLVFDWSTPPKLGLAPLASSGG